MATGVMLWGIGFIAILVAPTTSSFVDRGRRRETRIQSEELQERLDPIEGARQYQSWMVEPEAETR